jgi:hypothetical protein
LSSRSWALAALSGIAVAVALALVAAPASAKTVWLCKPGQKPDPCKVPETTTVYVTDGNGHVVKPKNAKHPKIDCFYVYPTVSEQEGPNADRHVDPQQTAIAQYQAARYSQTCRVFAPMYRQLTLKAISATEGVPANAAKIAFSDVLKAWRDYLRKYNHGRGVVLIGHSQGTGMLSELLRKEIERNAKQRKLLVSALLMGGNVTVPKGKDVGGSFRRTPVCHSDKETGCVVAFSTFGDPPPADAYFGKTDGALVDSHGVDPSKLEVVCTNPADLVGGSQVLKTIARSTPFPGTLGLGLALVYGGPQPTAPTPWLVPQDHYTGECIRENGAHVLLLSPYKGARHLQASPSAQWGLHLLDANIALGQLVKLVQRQAKEYARG